MTSLQYGNCTIDTGSQNEIPIAIWNKGIIHYMDTLKDPYYFWKSYGHRIVADVDPKD